MTCTSDGTCVAAGNYNTSAGDTEPFIQWMGNGQPPVIMTSSLPGARIGMSYSTQLRATGGLTPYKWKLVHGSGRLPKGLRLSSHEVIAGTPRARAVVGTYSFTVQVTTHKAKHTPKRSATMRLSLTRTPA